MSLTNKDLRNIQAAAKIEKIRASQSVSVNDKGGLTVEQQLLDALINNHPLHGSHKKCRQEKMKGSSLAVASVASSVTISGIGENSLSNLLNPNPPHEVTGTTGTNVVIPDTDMTFARSVIEAKKLAARVVFSNALLEDWQAGDLPSELLRDVSAQMSLAIDGSLFGTNSLFGGDIAGNVNVASTSVADVSSLALTDLSAAKVAAGRVYGEQPEWYISPSLFDGLITDLLSNAALPMSYTEDGRPRLLGLPVNLSGVLAGAGAGSGDMVVVCGSMRAASVYAEHSMETRLFSEERALNDESVYQIILRGGLVLHQPQYLSKIILA